MKLKKTLVVLSLLVSLGVLPAGQGLPGEFATNYDVTISDANANYLNPAQLMFIDRPEASLINTFLFEGTDLLYLNYSYPVRKIGTVAASAFMLYSGGIEAIDEFKNDLGDYSNLKLVLLASYAHNLNDMIYLGGSIKTVVDRMSKIESGSLEGVGAYGVGIDLGITYLPVKNFYVGMSLLNAPYLRFNDSENSDQWPLNLKLSVDYRALEDKLMLGLDSDFLDVLAIGAPSIHYEMEYHIRQWFSLLSSIDDREFGFGLSYRGKNLLKFGEDLEVAYNAGYNYRMAMVTNRLALTTRWGLSRKEKEMRRLGKLRKMAPINAFEEAMRLYHKRQYWDAGYAFGTVVSLYPEFENVDLAKFYIAECFFHLGLEGASEKLYRLVMEEYPQFKKMPECLARLQTLHYRRGEYGKVEEIYNALKEQFPQSKSIHNAEYLMGQVMFKRGAMVDAMSHYKTIPTGSEVYKYGQYQLALAYLHQGVNEKVAEHFNNIFLTPPTNKNETELVNRTSTILGHYNFELYDFPKAIGFYKKVSPTSSFYDDALIGHAWSLVNQQKYKEAIDVLNTLVKNIPNSIHLNEADLVKGYCYTLLKEYDRSIMEFTSVTTRCKEELQRMGLDKAQIPRMLSDQEIEVGGAQKMFADLEQVIFGSVIKKPSKKREEDAKTFNGEMAEKKQQLQDIKDALVALKENIKKVENYERILQNAEYAAATSEHLKKEEEKKKMDKGYESEIQRLEKELMDKLKKE